VNAATGATTARGRTRKPRGQAAALVMSWLADSSGLDETVWPGLRKSLQENRGPNRKLFRD
jgi:hypothetical protein